MPLIDCTTAMDSVPVRRAARSLLQLPKIGAVRLLARGERWKLHENSGYQSPVRARRTLRSPQFENLPPMLGVDNVGRSRRHIYRDEKKHVSTQVEAKPRRKRQPVCHTSRNKRPELIVTAVEPAAAFHRPVERDRAPSGLLACFVAVLPSPDFSEADLY